MTKLGSLLCSAVVLCCWSGGVNAALTENWDGSGTAGWAVEMPGTATLSNPGGYLKLAFAGGSSLVPSVAGGALAGAGSSVDMGSYVDMGVDRLTFVLKFNGVAPAAVRVKFGNATTEWFYNGIDLTGVNAAAGESIVVSVPLNPDNLAGWVASGVPQTKDGFAASLADVQWVSVQVDRTGNAAQSYGIDEFALNVDTSGAPVAGLARGTIQMTSVEGGGLQITWQATAGADGSMPLFDVWRSTNLLDPNAWVKIAEGVAPDALGAYAVEDGEASGLNASFYKIKVQQ